MVDERHVHTFVVKKKVGKCQKCGFRTRYIYKCSCGAATEKYVQCPCKKPWR